LSESDPVVFQRAVQALFEPPRRPVAGTGSVGVELELIPRSEAAPLPDEADRALERLTGAGETPGRYTFEPGGQLEYSTPAHRTLAALDADVSSALDPLRVAARAQGIELDSVGLAPRFGPENVGLRRPTSRYVAMDRYFARLGPWGPWMMRCTASLQVNLDLGRAATGAERWRLANLLSPVLVAAFANSAADLPDGTPLVSGRAWIWSRLDPGRTGALGGGAAMIPPWTEYLAFALGAPVMFDADTRPVRRADGSVPRFSQWWADFGTDAPTVADWRAHLGALFPDVRPRGWLEVRPVDVPARDWWSVPPALLVGLCYDDRARREAVEMLRALHDRTPDLAQRAMTGGLADAELREAAAAAFLLAEEGLERFPTGYVGPVLRTTAAFRERYVETGRTQADDAREAGEIARLAVSVPPNAVTGASLPPRPS